MRSSCLQMFCEIGVPGMVTWATGKYLFWNMDIYQELYLLEEHVILASCNNISNIRTPSSPSSISRQEHLFYRTPTSGCFFKSQVHKHLHFNTTCFDSHNRLSFKITVKANSKFGLKIKEEQKTPKTHRKIIQTSLFGLNFAFTAVFF